MEPAQAHSQCCLLRKVLRYAPLAAARLGKHMAGAEAAAANLLQQSAKEASKVPDQRK